MPISQPVYTNTLSSPPRSSFSPAAPASPPPSCTACPPVDGQVLRDSLLKLQPVKPHGCSAAVPDGRPCSSLPSRPGCWSGCFRWTIIIFINRRNSTVWQFPQNTIPGRHAFPVVAPPPNRRHRLLLGVLIGQRHGVLHGGHIVGVRSQPGLGEPVDHLEQ